MKDFEDSVVQHVLEKLLVEIDRGTPSYIFYTDFNDDGSSRTQQREVNVQHSILSKVMQQLAEKQDFQEKLFKKLETMIETDDFLNKVAGKAAENLWDWLNEDDNSWYAKEKFPNRKEFKESLRKQITKIIAQKQAAEILKKEQS